MKRGKKSVDLRLKSKRQKARISSYECFGNWEDLKSIKGVVLLILFIFKTPQKHIQTFP
jgi:hypothetical protein